MNKDLLDVKRAGSKFKRSVQIENIDVFNKFIDKIIPYHAAPFLSLMGKK